MKIKLIAKYNNRRTVIPLTATVAVIGRARGNAVRIPSAEVSRRHCRLIVKDGVLSVEDMDSVNGTFVNGKKLSSTQPVYPGDKIDVGPVSFTVEYELPAKGSGRPAPKEPSADLLEALADGDVMDAESLEDLPELEALDTPPDRGKMPNLELGKIPNLELESAPNLELEPSRPADDTGPLDPGFDFDAARWQMPEGGDLRDLLDEPTRPAKAKKKRGD